MENRKEHITLSVLSVIGILFGYAIVYPEQIGLCAVKDYDCLFKFPTFALGKPLLLGMFALALVFFVLLFLRHEVYSAWRKFAIWYIPIAFLLILIAPPVTSGFGPDRTLVTLVLGILYIAISLLIIFYKTWRMRNMDGS